MTPLRWIAIALLVAAALTAQWGGTPVAWNLLLCGGLLAWAIDGIPALTTLRWLAVVFFVAALIAIAWSKGPFAWNALVCAGLACLAAEPAIATNRAKV